MIRFSLVGGEARKTREYIERNQKKKPLDLDDLIDVSLFIARLTSFSLVKKKRGPKPKREVTDLKAIPNIMDFKMSEEAFISWFEPLLTRGYCGFYETFDKSVDLFYTSVETKSLTILEFRKNFHIVHMFVLTEESTKITMEVLEGLYRDIKGE